MTIVVIYNERVNYKIHVMFQEIDAPEFSNFSIWDTTNNSEFQWDTTNDLEADDSDNFELDD